MSQSSPVLTTPYEIARTFADAYASGDGEAAAELLHPDVHEREVVPGAIVDQVGPDAVIGEMRDFLAPYGDPEVLVHEVEPFGPKFRWTTRWRIRGGGESWLVEWHSFVTVADGLVTELDIVCSGRVPDA